MWVFGDFHRSLSYHWKMFGTWIFLLWPIFKGYVKFLGCVKISNFPMFFIFDKLHTQKIPILLHKAKFPMRDDRLWWQWWTIAVLKWRMMRMKDLVGPCFDVFLFPKHCGSMCSRRNFISNFDARLKWTRWNPRSSGIEQVDILLVESCTSYLFSMSTQDFFYQYVSIKLPFWHSLGLAGDVDDHRVCLSLRKSVQVREVGGGRGFDEFILHGKLLLMQ